MRQYYIIMNSHLFPEHQYINVHTGEIVGMWKLFRTSFCVVYCFKGTYNDYFNLK